MGDFGKGPEVEESDDRDGKDREDPVKPAPPQRLGLKPGHCEYVV
jgi:hypothetical protein